MDIREYDDKLVRLTDLNDDVWEGYVEYLSEEYCEHEYGKNEECLKMIHTLFFKRQIKNIEVIEEFSEPYGLLEESTLEDGLDLI